MSTDPKPSLELNQLMANALKQAVETTLKSMFGVSPRMGSWKLGEDPLALDPAVACMMQMKQNDTLCGVMVLSFNRDVVDILLQACGMDKTSDIKVKNEAVEEVVNIVYGAIKTVLNKNGYNLAMNLPEPVSGNEAMLSSRCHNQKMLMPFVTAGHPCQAAILATRH